MSFVYSHPFTGLANGLNTINAAGGGAVGGWVELGRTTLGSAGDTITVSSLSDKRYYMILSDLQSSGQIEGRFRLGNSSTDTGSNYAARYSTNGSADSTATSQSSIFGMDNNNPLFLTSYIANLSSKEKLGIHHTIGQNVAGAATAPLRNEVVSKWVNTSNPLDVIQQYNAQSGSFNTNSEVVVLGWDPDDTHTNNFWQELASVDNAGVTDNLSSGTFTAKKYLWVQFYLKPSGNNTERYLTFNNDTGSNYARRISGNGNADSTSTSQANINLAGSSGAEYDFHNMFIINNSSNEKLGIVHSVIAGATGASTAPLRRETVLKWDNTSSQITEIDLTNGAGGVDYTISGIRVWGAD